MTNDHEEVCMRFYHEDLCPAFRNVLDGAGYFNRNLFLRLLGGGLQALVINMPTINFQKNKSI